MNSQNVENLVAAIVTRVVRQGSYVTKTKLLKLLYLFDVEYYRVHRTTFTGFAWKFFHLGPWAANFDSTLEGLIANDILQQNRSSSESQPSFYKSVEPVELREPFSDPKDEYILQSVLNTWGALSTGEILDYVYFQTAPMEAGVRNEPLDFCVIQPEKPRPYSRSSSGKTKTEIQRLRTRFEAAQEQRRANQDRPFAFTPPKYDEEFFDAMTTLETA